MTLRSFHLALLAALWSGSAGAEPALTVREAWIPDAPPTSRVRAAYMELSNAGPGPVVVVGGSSPDFDAVEMHRTVQTGEGFRMAPQAELRLEPGEVLELAPGGLHLMLIGPRRELAAGDTVELALRLSEGDPVRASLEVRGPASGPP